MKGQLYSPPNNGELNYPCVMWHPVMQSIAVWHSPKSYTVLVQGKPTQFLGKWKDAPCVGTLITRSDGADLPCKLWQPLVAGTQILITV